MRDIRIIKYAFTIGLCSLMAMNSYCQNTFQSRYEHQGFPIRILDIEGSGDSVLVIAHSIDPSAPFSSNELKIFHVDANGLATEGLNIEIGISANNFIFNCDLKRLPEDRIAIVCSSGLINGFPGIGKHLIWLDNNDQYKIYSDSTSQNYLDHVIVQGENGFSEWRFDYNTFQKSYALRYQYDNSANPIRALQYTVNNSVRNLPRAAVNLDEGTVVGISFGTSGNEDDVPVATALIKLDNDGNVLYGFAYEQNLLNEMVIDDDENIYAIHNYGIVVKFDKNLNFIWARQIEDQSLALIGLNASKMYVDDQNNLVFTGPGDQGTGVQGNRTMKLDPSGNLILQKAMLDLVQRQSLGVTPLNNNIVSFGLLNTQSGYDFYLRSVDENGEAEDCPSISMCYDASPIDIDLFPVSVEVENISNLTLDGTLIAPIISVETIHICEPTIPPNANFEVIDSILCFGEEIEVNESSINQMGNSIWTIPQISYSDSTKIPSSIMLNDEGQFYLKHSLIFAGCEYVDSILIDIEDDEFIAQLGDTICDEESIVIDLESLPYQNVIWDDGDTSLVKTMSEDREYSFEYTSLRGCTFIERFIIGRAFSPMAGLDQEFIKCNSDQLLLFTDNTITPLWSNGQLADEITVDLPGSYTATFSNFCGEASQLFNVVEESCNLGPLANIFSPNGDGSNDLFEYSADGINILESMIYDRWGNPMHSYKGIAIWDGNNSGQKVNPGVYTYFIKYQKEGSPSISTLTGDVTIIR